MRTFFVLDKCYEYQNYHHGPVSHSVKKMDKKHVDVLLYDLHVSRFASLFLYIKILDNLLAKICIPLLALMLAIDLDNVIVFQLESAG